jgi:hypothetical protein
MAFYFINTSVDTADPNPEYIPEDLTINDQESIIELVVEQFLGYENAFVEYDDHDTEDHNKKSNVKLDYFSQYKVDSNFKRYCEESTRQKFPDFADRLLTLSIRPDTPPPKC